MAGSVDEMLDRYRRLKLARERGFGKFCLIGSNQCGTWPLLGKIVGVDLTYGNKVKVVMYRRKDESPLKPWKVTEAKFVIPRAEIFHLFDRLDEGRYLSVMELKAIAQWQVRWRHLGLRIPKKLMDNVEKEFIFDPDCDDPSCFDEDYVPEPM